MRIILLAILPIAALMIGRGYSAYVDRRIAECEELCELLSHIRARVECFLSPVSEMLSDFHAKRLCELGFIREVCEGSGLYEAYRGIEGRLSVSDEVRRVIGGFFEGFGKGYRDQTLRETDYARESLERILERDRAELDKSVRLTRSILLLVSVGIIILLI